MRLASLGHGPTGSVLLDDENSIIMLDCAAVPSLFSKQRAVVDQQEQQQEAAVGLIVPDYAGLANSVNLQVILVTSAWGLLGLAHLQQQLQALGRDLPIHTYCTEPCLHFFQQLSQELLASEQDLRRQQQQACGVSVPQQGLAAPIPHQMELLHQQVHQVLGQHHQQQQQQQQQRQPIPLQQQHPSMQMQQQQQQLLPGAFQPQQQQYGVLVPSLQHSPLGSNPADQIQPHHYQQVWQPPQLTTSPSGPAVTPPQPPPASPAAAALHSAQYRQPQENHPTDPTTAAFTAAASAAGAQPGPAVAPGATPAEAAPVSTACRAAGQCCVPLFSPAQLQGVLEAVQIVRFGQRVVLPGCFGITAEARPSGSGIGSCIWLLTRGDQRYAYLSPASLWAGPSAPLRSPSLLNLDALLVGPGSLSPTPCWGPDDMLQLALAAAVGAVSRGGRVLVPVVAGEGAVLQLLDHLPAALAAAAAGPTAAPTPLVYISPAAADALATANSCCEYLERRRQQQVLEQGTAPFAHKQLIKAGQLKILSAAAGAAGATGAAAGDGMQVDVTGASSGTAAAAAEGVSVSGDERVGDGPDWGPVVQEVMSLGPCVVFVPLWSLAAGPGALLAAAWCSSPLNLLLLPESGPLSATWLQQCLDTNLLPLQQQQQWRWQVQYTPLTSTAGAGLSPGSSRSTAIGSSDACTQGVQGCLTAGQLLAVLRGVAGQTAAGSAECNGGGAVVRQAGRPCQVVAGGRDLNLLEAALCDGEQTQRRPIDQAVKLVPLQEPPATHSSDPTNNATSSNTLLWQELQLPPPLLQASLSAEVADKLQLQRLRIGQNQQQQQQSLPHSPLPQSTAAPAGGSRAVTGQQSVHEVSVARLQALLTLQSGSWCLEAVPSGPRPEAVAAVLARQQHPQQELLWGTLDTIQLLADLQAAGFQAEVSEPLERDKQHEQQAGQPGLLVCVNKGAAQLKLSANETEVMCDCASMRKQLLECLMKQLHHVC